MSLPPEGIHMLKARIIEKKRIIKSLEKRLLNPVNGSRDSIITLLAERKAEVEFMELQLFGKNRD